MHKPLRAIYRSLLQEVVTKLDILVMDTLVSHTKFLKWYRCPLPFL